MKSYFRGYRQEEALKLLKPKEREDIFNLCNKADMEMARYGFDGGMIHSFFYDCVAGGIIKARSKPKDYVNSFYDFYIDMRCGKGYYSTQQAIIKILREIELIADKTKKPCALCENNTDKTAEQQIREINKHRKEWAEKEKQEFKEAVLSDKKVFNRNITKSSFICWGCCQDKLIKGE